MGDGARPTLWSAPSSSGVPCERPGLICGLANYCDQSANVCAPLKEDGQDCLGCGECISANCDTTGKCIAG